ncbi:MAG: electron transfer flavoprotein subunit beta/FixA family protein [Thermoleophilia bacterium]|nr:electron transfer flavoprotein subunit beta/FixA family protein [Thermoleophilia bacterium]
MRIIVCAKHVFDSTEVRFNEDTKELLTVNVPVKISDYDRNALEAAVALKEAGDDVTVEVIMSGGQAALKTLKEAVAMGADKGYLLEGGWETAFDPMLSMRVLARAIEAIGGADLVLCGLVSEDGYNGLTPPAVAELLGVPYLAPVVNLSADDDTVTATMDLGDVLQTVRAPFPCVLGIDSSMNVPRLPTVLQVMKVKSDRVATLSLEDLGLPATALATEFSTVTLDRLESGAAPRKALIIEGSPEEAVPSLVTALEREGVLA